MRFCVLFMAVALSGVAADAPVLGVWRATESGVPAVTLTITDEGGKLSGAVLFYLIRRDTNPPTSSAGIPEPLLNPHFDGKVLTFEVSHRRAHPPRTLSDPPVKFRLTLTVPDAGILTGGGNEIKVTRNTQ